MNNWNPTTQQEKELKDALVKLHASTDGVILTPMDQKREEAKQKRFILQGKSYFALKAYVMTGKGFPTTEAKFDEEIRKECFKELDKVDPDIYGETKKGIVKVGSSCSEFYDKDLYRMVNAGSLAVTWSRKTLGLLKHTGQFNLYDQLMVLVDTKYQKPSDRDPAWISASNAATFSLKLLIKEAVAGKTEAKDIRDSLAKFRDTTQMEVLPLVKILVKKYSKGPVENLRVDNKPYLTYLHEDLATLTKNMSKTLDEYNEKYDDWKTATGLAVGVGVSIGWMPILGWIPLGFAAHNADNLQKAWAKLEKSYNELVQRNQDEATLIKFIESMVKQFDGILEKIDGAIVAVSHLSTMFEEQSQAYTLIGVGLGYINDTTTEADANNRKFFIEACLNETVKDIQELQAAVAGFVEAILTENQDIFKKPSA